MTDLEGRLIPPLKVKFTPKGAYDTSIDVYKTCLGAYDLSGRQINTPVKVKSTPKGACGTLQHMFRGIWPIWRAGKYLGKGKIYAKRGAWHLHRRLQHMFRGI